MTYSYDAIVVGASAAGLQTARRLRDSGLRVLVIERSPFSVGLPTRSLIVTSELLHILGSYPSDAVLHSVRVMEMFAGSASATVALAEPDWIIDRARMNKALCKSAERSGVDIRMGETVKRVEFLQDSASIETADGGAFKSRIIIGADGVRSKVARAIGAWDSPVAPILQAKVTLPAGYDPSRARIWFEPALTNFFFWLIPDSNSTGVLGLVAGSQMPARAALDLFLHRHGFSAVEYQGAMIPLYRPLRKTEYHWPGGSVYLVGDAAGYVKTTTVGGLVSGLWGANEVAEEILNQQDRFVLGGARRELLVHSLLRAMLDRFTTADYQSLLSMLNDKTIELLGRNNRDTIAPVFFRLVRAQPKLLLLAAKLFWNAPASLRNFISPPADLALE